MSQSVHVHDKNMGLMLTPMHCYKKGGLWILDHQCQKALVNRSCNIDRGFGIQFKDKSDTRDKRPLLYHGRFVLAAHIKEHETPWKHSLLYNDCLTAPAAQLATRDMRVVEDLDPSALPTSYDDSTTGTIQHAARYQQIGEDAADKVISTLLQNVDFVERNAVLLIDLSPDVGDFFSAFVSNKVKLNTPMFYFGVCKDDVHLEWFEKTWLEHLAKMFADAKLAVPGFAPKSTEPPASLLESTPPKPQLNIMTWLPDKENKPGCPKGLAIPKSMVDMWYQHPIYGQEFRDFFDTIVQQCGSPDFPAINY